MYLASSTFVVNVVYFDQRLGAAQFKRWLESAFSTFFYPKKLKKGRKSKPALPAQGWCKKKLVQNFGPIPWQAAEIIGSLLVSEWQSYRVTELQSYKVTELQSDRVTEWQSYRVTALQNKRVTEWQTPKGTQFTGGWNFFALFSKKLPYLLCSQGDNYLFFWRCIRFMSPS